MLLNGREGDLDREGNVLALADVRFCLNRNCRFVPFYARERLRDQLLLVLGPADGEEEAVQMLPVNDRLLTVLPLDPDHLAFVNQGIVWPPVHFQNDGVLAVLVVELEFFMFGYRISIDCFRFLSNATWQGIHNGRQSVKSLLYSPEILAY